MACLRPHRPALVALSLAALAAAGPALAASGPAEGPGDEVTLEAGELRWDRGAGRVSLLDGARLTLGGLVLEAPSVVIDLAAGRAWAEAGATVTEGGRRLGAERLELDLETGSARAGAATLVADVAGGGRLRLRAEVLERVDARRYRAEGLSFTLCDCGPDRRPAWSLTAGSARLTVDEGVWLFGPVLRILGVPVLPLPVAYVPLAARRSGLLAPLLGWSGRSGLHLAQPAYLTLGRSWDLTLTPGWWSGRDGASGRPGVRGFEQALEVRYAPLRGTAGELTLYHLSDRSPEDPGDPDRARGERGSLRWRHRSRFGARGFGHAAHGLSADVDLAEDAALVSDLATGLEGREAGYLRSLVRAHGAPSPFVTVEAGARWLQDLRMASVLQDGVPVSRPLFGDVEAGAPATFQRLPWLHAASAPMPIGGGLSVRASLDAGAWVLPGGAFEDAGADRRMPGDLGACEASDPSCVDPGAGDGVRQPGERAPSLHTRASLDLGRGFHVGRLLTGRAGLGARADLWSEVAAGGLPAAQTGRFHPRADLSVGTAFARQGAASVHRIEPSVAWRWVPGVLGGTPGLGLEAWEDAVADDGLHQVVGALASRLRLGATGRLDLVFSQAWDVAGGRVDEAVLAVHAAGGPHRFDGEAAWSWQSGAVSRSLGRLVLPFSSGTWAEAGWLYLNPAAGGRLRAGLEEWVAAGAVAPSVLASEPFAGLRVSEVAFDVAARLGSSLTARSGLRMGLPGVVGARAPQPSFGLGWASACGCWSLSVRAVWPPGQEAPELGIGLGLGAVGRSL